MAGETQDVSLLWDLQDALYDFSRSAVVLVLLLWQTLLVVARSVATRAVPLVRQAVRLYVNASWRVRLAVVGLAGVVYVKRSARIRRLHAVAREKKARIARWTAQAAPHVAALLCIYAPAKSVMPRAHFSIAVAIVCFAAPIWQSLSALATYHLRGGPSKSIVEVPTLVSPRGPRDKGSLTRAKRELEVSAGAEQEVRLWLQYWVAHQLLTWAVRLCGVVFNLLWTPRGVESVEFAPDPVALLRGSGGSADGPFRLGGEAAFRVQLATSEIALVVLVVSAASGGSALLSSLCHRILATVTDFTYWTLRINLMPVEKRDSSDTVSLLRRISLGLCDALSPRVGRWALELLTRAPFLALLLLPGFALRQVAPFITVALPLLRSLQAITEEDSGKEAYWLRYTVAVRCLRLAFALLSRRLAILSRIDVGVHGSFLFAIAVQIACLSPAVTNLAAKRAVSAIMDRGSSVDNEMHGHSPRSAASPRSLNAQTFAFSASEEQDEDDTSAGEF